VGKRTVLLLGAGASVADVATRPQKSRPPLDALFFRISAAADPESWRAYKVAEYMRQTYGIDIFAPEHDSLEGIMSRLYPDIFNHALAKDAQPAFRALLQLFNRRLANTTNGIHATQKRLLYRMIVRLLDEGGDPGDIAIITFNQDIQVEKILEHLGQAKRWGSIASRLFAFPDMYSMDAGVWRGVTGGGNDLFTRSTAEGDVLRVLKLHGSLNWYSIHGSSEPSPSAMFNPHRQLSVTRRRTILTDMVLRGKRKRYTLPVIVPPVNHKSAVLPDALNSVWGLAERLIANADDVVIFGYSCPALDFESANLITRAHRARAESTTLSVIDPNGSVATRYIDLLAPKRLSYYATASDFLA